MTNRYLEDLNWRYAAKKFDSTKKVSQQDLDTILSAAQLSASSYGLQPYKILVIQDKETREKLKLASWNQSQITDASHLLVIANKVDFDGSLVDDYIQRVATTRNIPLESLDKYGAFVKSGITSMPAEQKAIWTAKQTYIVLANILSAAANLRIDNCPMEGFEAQKYNEILDLDNQGLNASVIVTIGYRAQDDQTQHQPKVRTSKKDLIEYI